MNILVLNGSPKGENSNTIKITKAFLEGMNAIQSNDIETVNVSTAKIEACLGCFCCWRKTPGKCVIQDDMSGILEKIIGAELIIWSFPLYYFGIPSKIKGLMDRMLPLNLPWIEERNNGAGHPSRYDMSGKRYVLISTCGFYNIENNYDALLKQYYLLYGEKNFTSILCSEGELLRVPQLAAKTDEYLKTVKQAGREYSELGAFTDQMKKDLARPFYPPKEFTEMANASWDLNQTGVSSVPSREPGLAFVRQMAAIYHPPKHFKKEIVLEFNFTDLGKTYQLCLGKEKCLIRTENFSPCTTRIKTSFDVWRAISEGKMSGSQAMMDHQYQVIGDFDTMLSMDEYFGGKKEPEQTEVVAHRKTNMSLLILPWFVIWILFTVSPAWGGIAGILSCTLVALAGSRWELTIYDRLTIVAVTVLSLLSMHGGSIRLLETLSYALFGIMWTVSGLLHIPLTAHYSKEDFGGEKAYQNPLFIKTNRILTLCWGVLYLLTTIWTYFLMNTSLSSWIWLINSACPVLMGIFTARFQKWYPAKVARR